MSGTPLHRVYLENFIPLYESYKFKKILKYKAVKGRCPFSDHLGTLLGNVFGVIAV
jgi:hypothetical protein